MKVKFQYRTRPSSAELKTDTNIFSTYFFVMFIWQSLNSAREMKLSVGEWFKLATTFCTLWLWLFCVRFSMLFTATTPYVDSFGVESWPTLERILEDYLHFSRLCRSQFDLTLLSLLWPEVCIIRWMGIPASSRTEMVVNLTQWFVQPLLKHAASDISFIMSPIGEFSNQLLSLKRNSSWFLKQCSLVRI